MVLSRTDQTSIFTQHGGILGRKDSAYTVLTATTGSTINSTGSPTSTPTSTPTQRSRSMRQLFFRRLSTGMQSLVSAEGGFDDVYPSDNVQVFDRDDDNYNYDHECEPSETTNMETATYSDSSQAEQNGVVILQEVPPAPTSVLQQKKGKNSTTRRDSTDTNRTGPLHKQRRPVANISPKKNQPRRLVMQKAWSERGMLQPSNMTKHTPNTEPDLNSTTCHSFFPKGESSKTTMTPTTSNKSPVRTRRGSAPTTEESKKSPVRTCRRISEPHNTKAVEKRPSAGGTSDVPKRLSTGSNNVPKSPRIRPQKVSLDPPGRLLSPRLASKRNKLQQHNKQSSLCCRPDPSPTRERRPNSPVKESLVPTSPIANKDRRATSPIKETSVPSASPGRRRSTSPIKEILVPVTPIISSPKQKRSTSPVKEILVPVTPINSSPKQKRSTSPVKEIIIPIAPNLDALSPETSSRRIKNTSPLCKASFVTRLPLSPTRGGTRQHQMSSRDTLGAPPKLRFDKCRYQRRSENHLATSDLEKFSMSDSRFSYTHYVVATEQQEQQQQSSGMGNSTPQGSGGKRRQSSRHPRRHADVLNPKRRVAPQRSRSLTDLRDMLRPKSDPRHKPRQNASSTIEKERNPLDSYFSSNVTVAPSLKDSVSVAAAPTAQSPAGSLGRRPLERRLERHKRLSSRKLTCDDDDDDDNTDLPVTKHESKTVVTEPLLMSPRSMARLPEQLASLRDMTKEDWDSIYFTPSAINNLAAPL